jgi:hypothetical protein
VVELANCESTQRKGVLGSLGAHLEALNCEECHRALAKAIGIVGKAPGGQWYSVLGEQTHWDAY